MLYGVPITRGDLFMIATALAIALLAGADAKPVDAAADAALPTAPQLGLQWKRIPDKFLLIKYFPAAAKAVGVTGAKVDLACTLDGFGTPKCEVYGETNPGLGFGDAAVMWLGKGQMTIDDGKPIGGRRFRYFVTFGDWKLPVK
jgi:hypothetical protein